MSEKQIVNCPTCGSLVSTHKTMGSTGYFLPENVPYKVVEELQQRLDEAIKKLNEVIR